MASTGKKTGTEEKPQAAAQSLDVVTAMNTKLSLFLSWWSWKKEIQHTVHTHYVYLPLSVSEYFTVQESGNKSQDFIYCWYGLPMMLSMMEF